MAFGKKNDPFQQSSPFDFDSTPTPTPADLARSTEPKVPGIKKRKQRQEKRFEAAPSAPGQGGEAPASMFAEQSRQRYAMDNRKRNMILLGVLLIVLIPVILILPTGWLTSTGLSEGMAGWINRLTGRINALVLWITGDPSGLSMGIVVWQTLAVVVVGAALALNGAVYQGALKNALASPSTLGVMSGGTLGLVVYTLAFSVPATEDMVRYQFADEITAQLSAMSIPQYIFATQGRALFSLAGCLVVVALVLLIAFIAGRGRVSKVALIIAGQAFTALIAGVTDIVRTYVTYNGTEAQLAALQSAANGSLDNIIGPLDFCLIAVPVLIGTIIVMRLRFRLNLLAFDDTEAKSMGIKTNVTRNTVVIICTIMTAVVVSFCGSVGFVGFLVPHLARKIVGPDFRYLIPASALLGASYLLLAQHLTKLGGLLGGSLGTFTSILGIVVFIAMAISQRRRGNVDWI